MIKPLGDRVVIKKIEVQDKTRSGIILTGSAKEEPQVAEVVAIGSGVKNDDEYKDEIKVGDKVMFSKYGGAEVKIEGQEYTILKIEDILAVLN